jgi:2-succinyl-5-enolpyruvyl-6-hydroxy-3-cyclohexene-1-carboxylate synthase
VAKATGRPAAVACTSGTAAANFAPAVHEATQAGVPLLVLTADRPPELRDVGAGQVIDQLKLFGTAAKWFVEVGTHDATPDRTAWIRGLACRAVWTAAEGRPGPVHLNFPLREPLVLDEALPEPAGDGTPGGGRAGGRPWVARPRGASDSHGAAEAIAPVAAAAERGIVVLGRHERRRPALGPAAAAFAAAAGWPLLADPLSGARTGPHAIAHYDALLRHEGLAAATAPDVVLRAGDLPTSKPLRQWLASADAIQVALDPEGRWQDPDHRVDLSLPAEPAATLLELAQAMATARAAGADRPAGGAYLDGWRRADAVAGAAIHRALGEPLSEPRIARELGAGLPPEATLFVSASMPIRDVETFAPARDAPLRVLSNRGANGIDGVISTAFGVAAGSEGPVVCLLGDVALAHDLGGLLAARRLRLPLTIVLQDNEGGGIFDFLPVAATRPREHYEVHVATPTGLDPAHVAQLFDLDYRPAVDVPGFRAALDAGLAHEGVTLIHVHTDRAHNVRLHREVWAEVARGLAGR